MGHHQESASSGVVPGVDYPALASTMANGERFALFRPCPSLRYESFDCFHASSAAVAGVAREARHLVGLQWRPRHRDSLVLLSNPCDVVRR
jgi:hypothetical protein